MALMNIKSGSEIVSQSKEIENDLTKIKSYTFRESVIKRLANYKESVGERSESFLVQKIVDEFLKSKGY